MEPQFSLDLLMKYIPLLIPLILIQFGLMIAGIIDIVKREKTRGPKWMWVLSYNFV